MIKMSLEKLPYKKMNLKTQKILEQLTISSRALAELKGYANTIPNQHILINMVTINEAKVLIPQFCMDFPLQYSNLCNNISILTSLMASWNSNGTLDYDSLVDLNYSNCTICGMFIVGENLCTLLYPRLASVNNSTDVATFYGDYKKICDDYMKQYPKPNYQ